ncbi:MAG: hypothetical protein CMJ81_06820 [Planctomycetaceae bacterium]|nr:hypothetical protein [Planctomycetaceae bacterium]
MVGLSSQGVDCSDLQKSQANRRRLKILLTEGSSITVRELLFAMGPHHTIDILDASRFCQGQLSRYVRRFYHCPSFSEDPDAYLSFLVDRLRAEQYDVLMATHEQVYLLSRFREPLSQLVGLAVPRFEDLHRVFSKAEFARVMQDLNLPTPLTNIVRTHKGLVQHDAFPCFVKLPYGTAGKGVRRAANSAEMCDIAREFTDEGWLENDNEVVIQQEAQGTQAAFYAVFDQGRLVARHCVEVRYPANGGWPSCIHSAEHPMVLQDITRLGSELQWHGALFVDYFHDQETGRHEFIECNPRIQAAFHAQLSGVDLADQLLRVSLGERVDALEGGRSGVRFHQGFLLLLSAALGGANRRSLLAECWRCLKQRGIYANSQDTLTNASLDWPSVLPAAVVTAMLLFWPRSAQWIVAQTVENYAMPRSTAQKIRELDPKKNI